MAETRDRVAVNIALSTRYATQRTFRGMALFDNGRIPTDVRNLAVTANTYSDTVGTSGTLYDACTRYFQLNARSGPPSDLYFGRLITAATASFWTAGSYSSDYTDYTGITTGAFAVTDGTNTDQVPNLDHSSCTSFADVLDVWNTALAGLTPTITGLASAEFSIDALGRLTLTHSVTGAAAPELSIVAPSAGTDITGEDYLDASNGESHAGFDVETPLESYTALKLIFSDFWVVFAPTVTDTELAALRSQINTEPRFLSMFEDQTTAPNPSSSADLSSQAIALGQKRCSATFSYTESYPDFAQFGGTLGALEGTTAFGFEEIENVEDSGQALYGYKLTPTQGAALEAKSYNWIETVAGFKNAFPGRSCMGQEIRLLLGRDWMQDQMQSRVYTARIQKRILGFDNASLTVYENEVKEVLEEAKKRRIITSYVMNVPNADDFTAAEKASHNLVLEDFFVAETVTDAWRYTISGNLTL